MTRFATMGQHEAEVAELLFLIERLEELHTKVQGMITPPHLAVIVLFVVLSRCSL